MPRVPLTRSLRRAVKVAAVAIAALSLVFVGLSPVSAVPPTGSVSGTVLDNTTAPVQAAIVSIQAIDGSWSGYANTDASGAYSLSGLGLGDARIRVNAPAGSTLDAAPQLITVSATASVADFTLAATVPMPAGTSFTQGSTTQTSGVAKLTLDQQLTISFLAPGGNSGSFALRQSGIVYAGGGLPEGPSGTYSTTVPPLQDSGILPGLATMTIAVLNGGVFLAYQIFDVYILSGGTVLDGVGAPVSGATVTLTRSDSPTGPFQQVPSGSSIMSPSNRVNPIVTGANGRYGWDVIPGYYQVVTTAPGYLDDDGTIVWGSRIVAVPPEIIDVNPSLVTTAQLGLFDGPLPTISGIVQAGQTLTANTGVWSNGATVTALHWLADGVRIPGAVDSTFTPTVNEIGKAITVTATGSLNSYTPRDRTSIAVGPVRTVFADIPTSHPFYTEIGWMRETSISNGFIESSGLRTLNLTGFDGGFSLTRPGVSGREVDGIQFRTRRAVGGRSRSAVVRD